MLTLFNLAFSCLAGIGGLVVIAAIAVAVYVLHVWHSDRKQEPPLVDWEQVLREVQK